MLQSREEDKKLRSGEFSRGVIVAISGLSPTAMKTARQHDIEVWDYGTITRMVKKEQQLGMKKFIFKTLDENYWSG